MPSAAASGQVTEQRCAVTFALRACASAMAAESSARLMCM